MTAAALLARLDALGVSAVADGIALRLHPASAIPADLLTDLRACKADLLALLTNPAESREPLPEHARIDIRQAAMVRGLLSVALQRPPSWAGPAALPSAGCFCSCCKGQRWWCEREPPEGWRCWACHPPDHLLADEVREART